jgi:hypothetical protein
LIPVLHALCQGVCSESGHLTFAGDTYKSNTAQARAQKARWEACYREATGIFGVSG